MKRWISKAAPLATGFLLGLDTLVGPAFVQGAAASTASAEASTKETRHWFPLTPVRDDFQATVLDGSPWVEAPTGKHGFVTVKGERFVFEDGSSVRLWGAQMSLWGKEQSA